MKNLATHLGDPRRTPQSQAIPGREAEMQKNPAGGFVFQADDWERLDRFLVIGTEGGTYYADERKLTLDNAAVVRRCLTEDAERTIRRIVEVSDAGRAPKNDYAILALALAFAAGDHSAGMSAILRDALQRVCRTGTHLFQFLQAVRGLRGGGRMLNGAVRAWVEAKPTDHLALQMVKYRNRAGWTWRDVLRRFRPKPPKGGADAGRAGLYAWAAGKNFPDQPLPEIVTHAEKAATLSGKDLAAHVEATRLPWECVPTEQTTDRDVLSALFSHMPLMATVRQIAKLQAHGVLSERREEVLARLRDEDAVRRSRIHPVALMLAADAYERGQNRNLSWVPDPAVVDALDDAFQLALKCAEPTGKRIMVAIDTSGSMHHAATPSGVPLLKVAAAMALTYTRTDNARVIAFDAEGHGVGVRDLPLSPRMRVTDAMRAIQQLGMGGGTDCSLPFRFALSQDYLCDAFVVFTDNETWAGWNQHPAQALATYRARLNYNAKVAWCAMSAGNSSLGLPDDGNALGVCGFDAATPQVVGNFLAPA